MRVVWMCLGSAVAAWTAVHPEYVARDSAGVDRLLKLLPLEGKTPLQIQAVFGGHWNRERDWGFGGVRFSARLGHGYAATWVEGFALDGRLVWARVGVDGSGEGWPLTRGRLRGGLLGCRDECVTEWEQPALAREYLRRVSRSLGERRRAVPPSLREPYALLTSWREPLMVGPGACGYELSMLPGREAVKAIVQAGRTDLLVDALRGPNPGGRVLALLELIRVRDAGQRLPSGAATAMARAESLPIPVDFCVFCLVQRDLLPAEVIRKSRATR